MEPPEEEGAALLKPQVAVALSLEVEESNKKKGRCGEGIRSSLRHMLLGTRVNMLLPFIPAAVAADAMNMGKVRTSETLKFVNLAARVLASFTFSSPVSPNPPLLYVYESMVRSKLHRYLLRGGLPLVNASCDEDRYNRGSDSKLSLRPHSTCWWLPLDHSHN